jgi:hypothetical protein
VVIVHVDVEKVNVNAKGAIAKSVTRNGKCMAQHGVDGQHGN